MTSFYTNDELLAMGFKHVGNSVKISRFARFYDINNISIGDNVRIDDFCILSGNITLGSHIHIAPYVALYGANGIIMEDYTGISARTTIYSAMDDFSGEYLVGPIHDESLTNVTGGPVIMKKYSQLCANVLVFPNLVIGEGVVIGACSMVRHSLAPWGMYVGIPAKKLKDRSDKMKRLTDEGEIVVKTTRTLKVGNCFPSKDLKYRGGGNELSSLL